MEGIGRCIFYGSTSFDYRNW